MTKRVQIAQDGVTVSNVSLINGGSPAGSGTFLDVADSVQVAPFWTWNGSTSSPVFTYGIGPTPNNDQARLASLEGVVSALNVNSAFVTTGDGMTVANLLTAFPPSAAIVGKYARVTDLYGSVDEVLRCRYDGSNYRWVPQRDDFAGNNAATGGAVTLMPLTTPPTLRLTATLLGNLTVTPSSTNAYIGQRFRVVMNGVLGIFAATITGLIGSNVTLLGGGTKDLEYGPGGWFQAA